MHRVLACEAQQRESDTWPECPLSAGEARQGAERLMPGWGEQVIKLIKGDPREGGLPARPFGRLTALCWLLKMGWVFACADGGRMNKVKVKHAGNVQMAGTGRTCGD